MGFFARCVFVALALLGQQGAAQEDTKEVAEESQYIIERTRFYRMAGKRKVNVGIRKEPVFQHVDTSRKEQGAIWVIGEEGRPLGISVLYLNADEPNWVHAVRSLSTSKEIGADLVTGRIWAPNSAGVKFEELSNAPNPKNSENLRLLQMRKEARRFSGYEPRGGTKRSALRLVPRELHHYQDIENGILDGMVFAIAHDTNPEAFLMLEIREDENANKHWHYALARFTFAGIHVLLDKKEAWKQPGLSTTPRNSPYYIYHVPRIPKQTLKQLTRPNSSNN